MSDLSILSKEDLFSVLKPLIVEVLEEAGISGNTNCENPLLTREEAAFMLDISLPTLNQWEKDGTIPKPKRLGKRVYFVRKVFIAFLESDSNHK
jgi:predicted DNA-binding transcriptional regulator AlpA